MSQEEGLSHDCNQRFILLFGVGKSRDEARHAVKKVVKEILKLFSKKTCMDIADGAKVKKNAKDGFNFEAAVGRFQCLSYFDQHVVTQQCASTVIEMLIAFATGNSNYLPLVEYIAFLFELMEIALNIYGLIEFTIQVHQILYFVTYVSNLKYYITLLYLIFYRQICKFYCLGIYTVIRKIRMQYISDICKKYICMFVYVCVYIKTK